jgi:SAM-dependent methyltransferase
MNMSQWDQLADIFGCKWNESSIPECAADNICIAWPSIINCIEKVSSKPSRLIALDFGCGGGLFCRKLYEMGFDVTGYDDSEELIKIARANNPEDVTITNSNTILDQKAKYDLLTSIMVFQFINDIDSMIKNIISLLKPNGLIIYAVFNPEFIKENSGNKVFTDLTNNQTGYLELKKEVKIPFFIRTASEYRHTFEKLGFKEVYLDFPAFTEEFLEKYKMPFSTKNSEFLIQAFRRSIT